MAYVDRLTGVNNRNHLEHYLNHNLWDSYNLIIFDINNLKQINDTYGHLQDDKLIVQFASLLKNSFSSNSTIVRLGGDEFLVLTNILKEEEILDKTNQINQELQSLHDSIPNYGVAYGYHTTINHANTYHEAFIMADKKMYLHKNGKTF
jgi:diguanylate cyclase (GGDEF)-like protein